MTKEELFNNNIAVAYKIANSYKINFSEEYEDICQVALESLWECCLNYNEKYALTTYAYKCIPNRINYYLRSVKKHRDHDISINTSKNYTAYYEDITIEDQLALDYDLEEEILNKYDMEYIKKLVDKLYLPEDKKEMFNLYLNGKSQRDIAKQFNTTQPTVSRSINRAIILLRDMYNRNVKRGEVYA